MAEVSKISWTDSTFNPWIGCTKVSPACDFCYAEDMMDHRYGRVTWGPHGERVRTKTWNQPLQWQRNAAHFQALHKRRQRVFCASLADVWDNAVPLVWQAELLNLIRKTPDLDWLLLTKRPQNIMKIVRAAQGLIGDGVPPFEVGGSMKHGEWSEMDWWLRHWWIDGKPPANVWLGVSTENQEEANRRIKVLLDVPAKIRFLSCEPLLGPLDLRHWLTGDIHWVIVGGESGKDAREMPMEWVVDIRQQTITANVAFLMKQLSQATHPRTFRDFDTFPIQLQVKQWPT